MPRINHERTEEVLNANTECIFLLVDFAFVPLKFRFISRKRRADSFFSRPFILLFWEIQAHHNALTLNLFQIPSPHFDTPTHILLELFYIEKGMKQTDDPVKGAVCTIAISVFYL